MAIAAIAVLSLLAAIVLTILAYKCIIPEKKRAGLNKLGKFIHDLLNFKFLIIEKVMQFFYVLANALTLSFGALMLFNFEKVYDGYDWYTGEIEYTTQWNGWIGILIVILGPIALRLTYELLMMGIMLIKNVIQINNKLKDQNENMGNDPFADGSTAEYVEAITPKAPENKFCINCGAALENGQCPNCHF